MRSGIEKLVYTTLLVIFCGAALGQPYRKLTADDFLGVPQNAGTNNIAYTNCSITYTYKAHREGDYYSLDFNILLAMNHYRSWIDRRQVNTRESMAEILKHEQGHYNLAYMEQQELLRTVSHTIFRENYRRVADAIFDRIDAKYKQLNADYDADTDNSMNRTQQHSWDVYFDRALGPILAYYKNQDLAAER
jgi:hypothetical protein